MSVDQPLVRRMFGKSGFRVLYAEMRAQSSDVRGVVRFAGAEVTQLTAASYAIERRGELGAADVVRLYSPFEPLIPLASLG
jgi:hypothetical protein